MGVKISADIEMTFDRMFAELDNALDNVLYAGAATLRRRAKESLISKVPASTNQNPLYNDTMADAPMYTNPDNGVIKVHVLGSGRKGSGTFRARFFEGGTKVRKQKVVNGKKLAKPRVTGQIKPTRFFETAVASSETEVYNAMEHALSKVIEQINSK